MKWLALLALMFGIAAAGFFMLNIPDAEAPAAPENETSVRENVSVLSRNMVTVYDGVTVSNNITVLDISNRGLTGSLKAEIGQLSKLRELNASNNNFTGVPAEIGRLTQLEKLDLSSNQITGLPLEIGNLQNLKILDLRGTNYSEFDLGLIKQQLPADTVVLIGGSSVVADTDEVNISN